MGVRQGTDTILAKTVFFDTFFTNWLKGLILQMLQQAKQGQCIAALARVLPQALN